MSFIWLQNHGKKLNGELEKLKNLWPSISEEKSEAKLEKTIKTNETSVNDDTDFVQIVHCLDGFAKVDGSNDSPWITSDNVMGHQILSEEEIVEVCCSSQTPADDSSDDNDFNIQESAGPSCSEASRMLEEMIVIYFEKQHITSTVELFTLRHL